ncbi:MAG: hypothetical protein GY852_10725, partial [bacterium]|nr:hypothetical protein [bacterium]
LNRLENPVEWRDLFAKNQKDRENSFYLAIENLLGNNSDGRQQILSMLELACLPFYSSFLPFTEEKKSKAAETKTSRVSVLD